MEDDEDDEEAVLTQSVKSKLKKKSGVNLSTVATYAFSKKHEPKLLTYDSDDSKKLHELFCKRQLGVTKCSIFYMFFFL